ncbi:MAG TPA: phospho-N-acetylmuramoyl-pentapeptide-transferase [Armatimonadota bacterium]|nr:phospho-N-acetylmuramoyl-pentapeptide-transferase [Armatimonadota bacterium]
MTPLLLLAFLCAFGLAFATLPGLIRALTRRHAEQVISEDVPETHQAKKGTPTLGGLAIVLPAAVVSLVYAVFTPGAYEVAALVILMLATGGLGFLDDYLILSRGRSAGQKWNQKLGAQALLAALFIGYLWFKEPGLSLVVIPGTSRTFNTGLFWIPLAIVYLAGMSNAVNLSDGLDGLAGGLSLIAGAACAAVALAVHRPDLAIFSVSICGACLGFLWYNCHPAQIFMGNTSSIALGMSLAGVAIVTRQEILLLIPFGVFVVEALSVVVQVGYYKRTHRRVFLKAPIHHHFEMLGWKETRVVVRFWIVGLILALVALLLLYSVG